MSEERPLNVSDYMDVHEVAKKPLRPAYPRIKVGTSKRVTKTYIYNKELGKVVEKNGES